MYRQLVILIVSQSLVKMSMSTCHLEGWRIKKSVGEEWRIKKSVGEEWRIKKSG